MNTIRRKSWKLHENDTCCFEKILEEKSKTHKTAAVGACHKPSKLDEQDMLGTSGQVRTFSYKFLYRNALGLAEQQRFIYMNSTRIQDVT